MQIPFIGGSYTMPDRQWNYQRTVNMYPQADDSASAKTVSSLVSIPGLKTFTDFGEQNKNIRGMWVDKDGRLFVVHGANFGRVDEDGTFEDLNNLLTSSGPIQMASNGPQIVIVDGEFGYVYNEEENTFFVLEGETSATNGWLGSETVTYIDSFFIFVEPGTQKVYLSESGNAESISNLDFASAEGSPDNIVTAANLNAQLWLFGTNTVEIWVNSGDPLFPFTRIPGAVLNYGILAKQSVVSIANSLFWVGRDASSLGGIYTGSGNSIQRISTAALDFAISGYGDISDATAWGYEMNGHTFYVINFPSANTSWAFDLKTGLWHERQSYSDLTNTLGRSRPEHHVVAYNKHLVSDFEKGKIYELTETVNNEDGQPLVRIRRSPHLASPDMHRVAYHTFELQYSCGYGYNSLDNGYSGEQPMVTLSYSDDGGFTWSNNQQMNLGLAGQYGHRARWHRLGAGMSRVWEVRCSDNTRFSIFAANVLMTELSA